MNEWLYVALFIIVGLIIPIGAIAAGFIFGPKKPNPIKESTYECGSGSGRSGDSARGV